MSSRDDSDPARPAHPDEEAKRLAQLVKEAEARVAQTEDEIKRSRSERRRLVQEIESLQVYVKQADADRRKLRYELQTRDGGDASEGRPAGRAGVLTRLLKPVYNRILRPLVLRPLLPYLTELRELAEKNARQLDACRRTDRLLIEQLKAIRDINRQTDRLLLGLMKSASDSTTPCEDTDSTAAGPE